MTARNVDLNFAVAGCGIGRTRRDLLFGLGLVNNLNRKKARFRANRFDEPSAKTETEATPISACCVSPHPISLRDNNT